MGAVLIIIGSIEAVAQKLQHLQKSLVIPAAGQIAPVINFHEIDFDGIFAPNISRALSDEINL